MAFNKRGISPLIATILLIGFTVALAAIIFSWGNTFIRGTKESTESMVQKEISCSKDVRLDIKDAELLGDKLKLKIENAGKEDIENFRVRVHGSDGVDSVETFSGLASLEIQNIEVEFNPDNVGAINEVEVLPAIKSNEHSVVCSNCYDKIKEVSLNDEGLVLYLSLDGNADSPVGMGGTVYGNPLWVNGVYGQALDLDGKGDEVRIDNNPFINFSGKNKTSWEVWIKPNNDGELGYGYIFSKKASSMGSGYTLMVHNESNGLMNLTVCTHLRRPGWGGSTPYFAKMDKIIPINQWSHIVVVFNEDKDNKVKIYLNGVMANYTYGSGFWIPPTEQDTYIDDDGTYLSIGVWWEYRFMEPDIYYYFNGTIDELRVYNRTLSYSEIKAHYLS